MENGKLRMENGKLKIEIDEIDYIHSQLWEKPLSLRERGWGEGVMNSKSLICQIPESCQIHPAVLVWGCNENQSTNLLDLAQE